MKKYLTGIIVVLIVIITLGVWIWAAPVSTNLIVANLKEWMRDYSGYYNKPEIYNNQKYGYQITIPASFEAYQYNENSQQKIADDKANIVFIVDKRFVGKDINCSQGCFIIRRRTLSTDTFPHFINTMKDFLLSYGNPIQEDQILVDGTQATQIKSSRSKPVPERDISTYLLKNKLIFSLEMHSYNQATYSDYKNLYNQMLASVRLDY